MGPQEKFGGWTLVRFIDLKIGASGKSEHEIAAALGYRNPSVITMFRRGLTRIPLDKVRALADALGVSRTDLMKRVLCEYAPDLVGAFEECSGNAITDNELEILQFIRGVSGGGDPPLASDRQRALLVEAFGSLGAQQCNADAER